VNYSRKHNKIFN